MSKQKFPNLFDYATSELSHDAFIAWLATWADPDFNGYDLHKLSNNLIMTFFDKHDESLEEIKKVEVKRQYNNIDVLIIVTDQNSKRWGIIIENKIQTKQHSDQMTRYSDNLHEDKEYEDITKEQILGIYYKMWEQSDLTKVKESGFEHFAREDMLDLMKMYNRVENHILDDYQLYLQELDEKLNAYKTLPLDDWSYEQWIGFFSYLKKKFGHTTNDNFSYVPNESGGFMGYWCNAFDAGDCEVYIQLERDKFTYRISVSDEDSNYRKLRSKWHDNIIKAAKDSELEVEKPQRFGHGKTMTVAKLKHDYRIGNELDGSIDLAATRDILKKAIAILDSSIDQN